MNRKGVIVLCVCLCAMFAQAPTQFLGRKNFAFYPAAGGGGDPGLPFGGLVSTNSLVAYWRMDEVSDGSAAVTRNDTFGANHLTDISTFAASASGMITNAIDIENSVTEALTLSDNAAISMAAGTSFTITGWIRLESTASTWPLISKGSGSGTSTEYLVWVNSTTDFRARVADTVNQGTATNTVTPTTATWYFVAFRVDLAADELKLRVNTTDSTVTAYTGDTVDGSSTMNIGRVVYATSNRADGLIDEVGIWKRVLSNTELDALYNSGAGRTY